MHGVMERASRALRVTHVLHDFDGGGLESLVARLAGYFDGHGVRSSVISLSGRVGRTGDDFRSNFDQVIPLRPTRGISMIAPVGLVRAIRQTRADVVHLHSGVWFKGALAARLAGVPLVLFTEHGREHHDPATARWLDRQAARLTDVVVPVSPRLGRYMRRQLGIPQRKIRVVQNGVDLAHYAPGASAAELRRRHAIPDGSVVVGSMGRLEPVKGYDRLLSAFASACDQSSSPAVLVLFGDGSQRDALQGLARDLGVADRVRLPGWVRPGPEAYRLFDVFALASHSEGLSLSLLEAMACGAVPVVNDVGANGEVLGAALREQLVDADDMKSLARLLAATIDGAERRAAMGPLARAQVEERYGFDRVLRDYLAIYSTRAETVRWG